MKLEVISNQGNILTLCLKDSDYVFANTLRRIMTTEVPTLAIQTITFTKNTSALFEEIIAHRLGLIPLKTDLEVYTLPEKCSCKGKGCNKCQSTLTLKAEGPITVHASDLKFQDEKVKPVYGKIPVIKVLKDQELEFEATVSLGLGKSHAKHIPALVFYKGYPKITIDSKLKNEEEALKSCPINVFELKGKKLEIKNLEACHLCNACAEIAEPKGSIKVESSEKDFIFTIESWGQLSPKEIFSQSLKVLDEKLTDFKALLKKVK